MTSTHIYRADRIQRRLEHHFLDEIHVGVASPEPTWWRQRIVVEGAGGPTGPLGWCWPMPNPEHVASSGTSPMIVAFCAPIIDDQTQDLTDDELDIYLDLIEGFINMHLVYWDEEDAQLRHDRIISDLTPDQHALLQAQFQLPEFRRSINEHTTD